MDTGAGTKLHYVVGGADCLLIVLHHYKGVAYVPEVLEGIYELLVVPLVEPDGGLVQDIEHSHKGAADLCCKPYALGLAAGQGCSLPVQGKITKANRIKELEPCLYLLHYLAGNLFLGLRQLKLFEESLKILYRT